MHQQCDFSNSVLNRSAQKLKQQITIKLNKGTIAYFKGIAAHKVMLYNSLINLYFRNCVQNHWDFKFQWQ